LTNDITNNVGNFGELSRRDAPGHVFKLRSERARPGRSNSQIAKPLAIIGGCQSSADCCGRGRPRSAFAKHALKAQRDKPLGAMLVFSIRLAQGFEQGLFLMAVVLTSQISFNEWRSLETALFPEHLKSVSSSSETPKERPRISGGLHFHRDAAGRATAARKIFLCALVNASCRNCAGEFQWPALAGNLIRAGFTRNASNVIR